MSIDVVKRVAVMNKTRINRTHVRCWYCGRELPVKEAQVEHQIPGCGKNFDHLWNLVPACGSCNVRKGNRDLEAYRSRLSTKMGLLLTQACPHIKGITEDGRPVLLDTGATWGSLRSEGGIVFYGESMLNTPNRVREATDSMLERLAPSW